MTMQAWRHHCGHLNDGTYAAGHPSGMCGGCGNSAKPDSVEARYELRVVSAKRVMPTTLQIGHLRYTVVVDDNEINRHNTQDRCDYAGFSNASTQRIVLRSDLAPDYEAETVLHELVHQCLRAAGCDPDADGKAGVADVEERTVRALSGPLLGALRANQDLVTYLLHSHANQEGTR